MKTFEPSDPHELVGIELAEGDAHFMAECLVEEYLLLGWSDGELMTLFTRPCFRMTHRIYLERGQQYVAELIAQVRAKWTMNQTDGCNA
ncbi:MAG: hypothetical protein F9K44_07100 [Hyphomicrobiaceae bacterium]|nr:MAG: hypothetical protein F9K44_07100 [Hyphomicrobiaceae bacterium]